MKRRITLNGVNDAAADFLMGEPTRAVLFDHEAKLNLPVQASGRQMEFPLCLGRMGPAAGHVEQTPRTGMSAIFPDDGRKRLFPVAVYPCDNKVEGSVFIDCLVNQGT